jgi:hypothetical protein
MHAATAPASNFSMTSTWDHDMIYVTNASLDMRIRLFNPILPDWTTTTTDKWSRSSKCNKRFHAATVIFSSIKLIISCKEGTFTMSFDGQTTLPFTDATSSNDPHLEVLRLEDPYVPLGFDIDSICQRYIFYTSTMCSSTALTAR